MNKTKFIDIKILLEKNSLKVISDLSNDQTFNSIKKLTDKHITIGGGVKDLNDIELSRSNGFNNVVVGKAIYENKISIDSLVQFNA